MLHFCYLLCFHWRVAWVQCIWWNSEWKCRIAKNMLSFLMFLHESINCEENRLDLEVPDLNKHMVLSCYLMLIVWTTSFSFQRNELNARGLKLSELHRNLSNCGKIAHSNSTLLFAVGCLASLPLLALCVWFTGLLWWALMPWTVQVLVKYSWHQYYGLSTWWLQNQSIRHSMNWMKIQS